MPSAATRDASWYARPNTRAVNLVHIDNGRAFALCDSQSPLTDSSRWDNAADVPEDIRCRRRACANVYAANDSRSENP